MRTLTDANAAFTISVPDVFAVPVPIEGFSTDDAWDTENIAPSEAMMGVDGKLSAGYTPYPVKLKFVLQADSLSIDAMDTWIAAMKASKETFWANATIVVPGTGKLYTFTKGSLTQGKPTPQGQKVLRPQTYEVTFESYNAAPV